MILVTGATGHIGNVLVRELLESGQAVRALVLPHDDLSSLYGLTIEIVVGNVLDPLSLEQAMQGIHVVYHLASIISIMPGKDELLEKVNVQGTINVLEAAQRAGVNRVVYTSSIHALGRPPHNVIIDEQVPFDPQNTLSAYDRSKARASLAVLSAAQAGLNSVIVCPTGVIGPYDFRRSEMGGLIQDAMQHKPQLCLDGAYDFVDVRDVAHGHILAYEKGVCGETYILSGERVEVPSLLDLLKDITGVRNIRIRVPLSIAQIIATIAPLYYRLGDIRPRLTHYSLETLTSNSKISSAKARRELGYSSRPLVQSLVDTVRWLTANRIFLKNKA